MHLAKVAAAPLLAGSGCGSRWPLSSRPAVWTFSRHGPHPGDAPESSHESYDVKIAPRVKRAPDSRAQKCALCPGRGVRGADGGSVVKTARCGGDRAGVIKIYYSRSMGSCSPRRLKNKTVTTLLVLYEQIL